MKKTFQRMCCLFIILLTSTAHGQLIAPEFQTSMTSPDNSALIKNIENNMNYYDGTLQIQIPLYTLKEFDLEVPISLMYKTGGIKIEDVATSVGLGWNLSAGGKITRIIKRNPDEASDGYFNLPSKEYVDQLLTQKVISMIFASIFGLIDLFVFKNLYDKYCNHSNITAYKTNIVIPAELKALNNIRDLPD